MRRMLKFLPLLFVIMLASPPGFIMADPVSDHTAPAQANTPEDGQVAFIMNAPNCFIMADGTQKCADIGMRTLALRIGMRNPAVALDVCVRKPKPEPYQPMQGGHFRGVRGGLEHVVKADTGTVAEPHNPLALTCFLRKPTVRS